jgi:hypothetical protein
MELNDTLYVDMAKKKEVYTNKAGEVHEKFGGWLDPQDAYKHAKAYVQWYDANSAKLAAKKTPRKVALEKAGPVKTSKRDNVVEVLKEMGLNDEQIKAIQAFRPKAQEPQAPAKAKADDTSLELEWTSVATSTPKAPAKKSKSKK